MYANQSLRTEVFACPFCRKVKTILEARDVDFAMMVPGWKGAPSDIPDYWRRVKTPTLICEDCAP